MMHYGLGARSAIGLGLGGSAPNGASNGLLNNLIAYWPLNEAAGANNALDLHTNGLTLTQFGSPGSAAGKVYAGARDFTPIDYFSRASGSLLQVGGQNFAFAFWFWVDSIAGYGNWLISKRGDTTNLEYEIAIGPDSVLFFVAWSGAALQIVSTAAISTSAWHFGIAWFDAVANILNVSLDNGTTVTQALGGAITSGTNAMMIGIGSWIISSNLAHDGRIGPVAMWKSAAGAGGVLTAAQRTALWNGGNGLAYANFTT